MIDLSNKVKQRHIILIILSVICISTLPCFWPPVLWISFTKFWRSFFGANCDPYSDSFGAILGSVVYIASFLLLLYWLFWIQINLIIKIRHRFLKACCGFGGVVFSFLILLFISYILYNCHKPKNIWLAVEWGDTVAIQNYIAGGIDPDARNENEQGLAPLHYAVIFRKINVVKLLLKSGANVNAQIINSHRTPLHLAVRCPDDLKMIITKVLIDNGADVNEPDFEGNTAIHIASFWSNKYTDEVVNRLLLKNGSKVNVKNIHGETPLHLAALPMQGSSEPNVDYIELLLQHGADVNAITNKGQTPLDIALDNEHTEEAVNILRKHGGKTGEELGKNPASATQPTGK